MAASIGWDAEVTTMNAIPKHGNCLHWVHGTPRLSHTDFRCGPLPFLWTRCICLLAASCFVSVRLQQDQCLGSDSWRLIFFSTEFRKRLKGPVLFGFCPKVGDAPQLYEYVGMIVLCDFSNTLNAWVSEKPILDFQTFSETKIIHGKHIETHGTRYREIGCKWNETGITWK